MHNKEDARKDYIDVVTASKEFNDLTPEDQTELVSILENTPVKGTYKQRWNILCRAKMAFELKKYKYAETALAPWKGNINLVTRNSPAFTKAYDLVTIGMRLAYLSMAGHIEIDTTVYGEEELTEFALTLSDGWDAYVDEHEANEEMYSWDEYIEEAIIKKYGRCN